MEFYDWLCGELKVPIELGFFLVLIVLRRDLKKIHERFTYIENFIFPSGKPDEPTPASVRKLFGVFACLVILTASTGCVDTKREESTKTNGYEKGSLSGSVQVPVAGVATDVPFRLSFERETALSADSIAHSNSQIDPSQIAALVGGAVNTAVKQMVPALAPLLSRPAETSSTDGWVKGAIGLAGSLALAYGTAKATQSKSLKEQVEFHKADAAEGWSKAVAPPTESA